MNERDTFRVFLVTNRFEPSRGGIERQSRLLAQAFRKRGIGVTVLTDRFTMRLPAFEDIDGIPVRRVWSLWTLRRPFEGIIKALLIGKSEGGTGGSVDGNAPSHRYREQPLKRRLLRFFSYKLPMYSLCMSVFVALVRRRNEYDIIQVFQTNLLAFAAVLAGRIAGKPVVARDAVSGGMDELTEFLFPKTTSSTIAGSCTFIALSRHIEKDLVNRGIPALRIVRIPNSVELRAMSPPSNASITSVLFVGNVSGDFRQKGLDILLKAWKRVIREVPGSHLTIIGGGDFSTFRSLAETDQIGGTIQFAGLQENAGEWYKRCGIFVLPSRYEGMSNALLEAMSYGKPCVATNISGSDDLIQDGENGLKVASENPEELARAIISLMKNPKKAQELGKNARATIEKHHTPDTIAERYAAVYCRLLKLGVRQ
jgi:glycosyltransferase involved in cell wall biosynthesis